MQKYKRKAIFEELLEYDVFSNVDDFIEVTEWSNSEGVDVEISTRNPTSFQLTWGQFSLLEKLIKEIQT